MVGNPRRRKAIAWLPGLIRSVAPTQARLSSWVLYLMLSFLFINYLSALLRYIVW
jgi:hypothetical protein